MLAMVVSWCFGTAGVGLACSKTGMSALDSAGNHEKRVPPVRLEYARGELRIVMFLGELPCHGPECRSSNKMSHTPAPALAVIDLVTSSVSGHDEFFCSPKKTSGRLVAKAVGSRLDGYLGLAEKPPRFEVL